MEKFLTCNPWLFRLSRYTCIKGGEKPEIHLPDPGYGDFLDLEWEFIDADLSSPDVGKMMEDWAKDSIYELCRIEHARWMLTELLIGFKPYTIKERKKLIAKVRKECKEAGDVDTGVAAKEQSPTWKQIRRERKLNFTHIDIAPFDELIDEEEKLKDINLMVNIPYILGETSDIYRYDSSGGKVVRI